MTNHLIWAAGLLGDLLLLTVLFMRRRATRFPWFMLFIVFYLLRSVGLAAALHFSGRPVHLFATMILDLMDILQKSLDQTRTKQRAGGKGESGDEAAEAKPKRSRKKTAA